MKFRYDKILGRNWLERLFIRFAITISPNGNSNPGPINGTTNYILKLEFDIPVLILLSIDEMRGLIGNPNYQNNLLGFDRRDLDPIEIEPKKRDSAWDKKNFINNWYPQERGNPFFMEVSFNSNNRKLNYIFLGNSKHTATINDFLLAGNLKENDDKYIIKVQYAGKAKNIISGIQVYERKLYNRLIKTGNL